MFHNRGPNSYSTQRAPHPSPQDRDSMHARCASAPCRSPSLATLTARQFPRTTPMPVCSIDTHAFSTIQTRTKHGCQLGIHSGSYEIGDLGLRWDRRAGVQHDPSADNFAEYVVGNRHGSGFDDSVRLAERVLDCNWREVLAAADDQVLDATNNCRAFRIANDRPRTCRLTRARQRAFTVPESITGILPVADIDKRAVKMPSIRRYGNATVRPSRQRVHTGNYNSFINA